MIFINRCTLNLPGRWIQRAQRATQLLSGLPDTERKAKINKRLSIWGAAKQELSNLSNGKCWYCESRQVRSNKDVDHFRPKNGVIEDAAHPGYWWLAFEQTNYRFSCNYCNSHHTDDRTGVTGGKQDHFPLLPGSTRAMTATANLNLEFPELLDPCMLADTLCLIFSTSGQVSPRYSNGSNSIKNRRAETSIRVYHLNHSDLVDARAALGVEIDDLINQAGRFINRTDDGSADWATEFEVLIQRLKRLMAADAEYSSFANAIVKAHRDKEWVDALLHV